MLPRILVVEDEEAVACLLEQSLAACRCAVERAADIGEARTLAQLHAYDLVLLDLNLPSGDGLQLLREIRTRGCPVPVLILSSRSELEDRVKGLELGADDYLSKPFAISELSARVRALLRRTERPFISVLELEDLVLNRVDRTVHRAGKAIDLTSKEFALLEYLMLHAGQYVTRAMLLEHVWKMSLETITNVVDVYISYLRKKVDEGFESKLIHTVRSTGYYIGSGRTPAMP